MSALDAMREGRKTLSVNAKRGNPAATSDAILQIVDAPKPPLRVLLGAFANDMALRVYAERVQTWQEWGDVGRAADGE